MKYIFLFLFPVAAYSQDSTSTSFDFRDGVFFVIEKTYLSGGRVITDERPADADTAAAVNQIIFPALKSAIQYAEIAATAARINVPRKQVNEASLALQSLTGRDYYETTNNLLISEFLPSGEDGQPIESVAYTMRVNGTPIPVTLRRNATDQLVMRQGATNFRVEIVSRNWIRIRRYQGTEVLASEGWVDLFQERNGAFISADLKYQLRQ